MRAEKQRYLAVFGTLKSINQQFADYPRNEYQKVAASGRLRAKCMERKDTFYEKGQKKGKKQQK